MARRKVTAKPRWIEKQQRWRIDVQRDGARKYFYSNTPGRSGKFECIEQAEAWINEEPEAAQEPARDPTISEVYSEWLEESKLMVGTSEFKQRERMGRLYILPQIGRLRMSRLTNDQQLQKILNNAFKYPANGKKPLSKKTLQGLRGIIVGFVSYCRKCGLTSLRPETLTIPRKAETGTRRILQPDDLRVLFTSDETTKRGGGVCQEWSINAFRFITLTSLRPGEVIGLRWADIRDGYMRIQQAINVYSETTSGKNDNARRGFPLPQIALKVLEAQRAMLEAHGVESEYVFSDRDGEPTREQTMLKRLQAYCRHNGIQVVTLYELRHTWFSVNKSMPAEYVKTIGGHSASMDTFGVYGHEVDGDKEKAARMIDERISGILGITDSDRTFDRT